MECDILKKRRTLPKSRCEVRRSQCSATPISSPPCLPSFAHISQWILRMAQTRCGPIKQDSSSGDRDFGCPQANTRHILRGAVALGTHGKWLRRQPLEGQACNVNWALSVSANGGLSAHHRVKSRVAGRSHLLNRDFTPGEHNRVWMSDITYIPTRQGWVYLAGIKELRSRKIVGFSLAERMDTGLVLAALMEAVRFHRPTGGTDSAFGSRQPVLQRRAYQKKLRAYGLVCSMSKKGDCYDSASMESSGAC